MTDKKYKRGLAIYAGGNHIFYIIGVLKYLQERGLKFEAVATYSAGGAILPFVRDGNYEVAVTEFKKLTDHNSKNFYASHILSKKNAFPHDDIYSAVIKTVLDMEKITTVDKPIKLIVSVVGQSWMNRHVIGFFSLLTLLLYGVSKKVTGPFFLKLFKKIFGIHGLVERADKNTNKENLSRLIMGSSTIYPFIKIRKHMGKYLLDGKFSMLTPIGELDDCENVLSIHAHYTFPTERENLIQLLPFSPVGVAPLDYVGSEGFVEAFDQGYEDGKAHYERLKDTIFFNEF